MGWPFYPRPAGIPHKIPRWAWNALKVPGKVKRVKPAWFWLWRKWRLAKKPLPVVTKVWMYDDVNVALIPKDAEAVAGYIGGRWPTYPKVVEGWPNAKHLSIAVSTIYSADALDVEPGDASIGQAAMWVKKQLKLRSEGNGFNTSRPVVYTSASWGQSLVNALEKAGLKYGQDFLWWSAHYDPSRGAHICSPKCEIGRAHV